MLFNVFIKKYCNVLKQLFYLIIGGFLGLSVIGCKSAARLPQHEVRFSKDELLEDFAMFRQNLEEVHPGLYWYTSKDEMDASFEQGQAAIRDSMAEKEFRLILMRINSKIKCGHTSIQRPKKSKAPTNQDPPVANFPYDLKYWDDTLVVIRNRSKTDSLLKRGTIIKSINGRQPAEIFEDLFSYMSSDGENTSYKALSLASENSFENFYTFVYGVPDTFTVEFLDSLGHHQTISFIPPSKIVAKDTTASTSASTIKAPNPSKRELRKARLDYLRFMEIDTTQQTAILSLQTFSVGYGIRKFIKRSFKTMERMGIRHLVIDVRGNGGGQPSLSTHLSRYLSKSPFIIADSLYAINRKIYTPNVFLRASHSLKLFLSSPFQKGGQYHLKWYERKVHKTRHKSFFDGNVYVLTGPASFSATVIFLNTIKGQDNVTIVGEETGGGAYGNTAFIIPILTLPNTQTRLRLPVFRFVDDVRIPKDGRGIIPDVPLRPNLEAIKAGKDFKMEWIRNHIKQLNESEKQSGDHVIPTRKNYLSH